MAITPLTSAPGLTPAGTSATPAGSAAAGFADSLQQILDTATQSTGDANAAVARMLDGSGDVHEAMIALQRADVMLQLTMQIRNKLVQAYQDVMRMPV